MASRNPLLGDSPLVVGASGAVSVKSAPAVEKRAEVKVSRPFVLGPDQMYQRENFRMLLVPLQLAAFSFAVGCAWYFLQREPDKWICQILYVTWMLAVPAWFCLEYLALYNWNYKHFEKYKHAQDVLARFWTAAAVVLALLYWIQFQDNPVVP